jgi:hypothetical protein
MTETALAGDRRIGMVAVLPTQIASMRGNPAAFLIGCARIIEDGDSWLATATTSFYSEPRDFASGANGPRQRRVSTASPRSNDSRKRMIPRTARNVRCSGSPSGGFVRLAELEAARAPHSGSLRQFIDVVEKLRNFKHRSKILRFFEIRSGSISTRGALQQGANGPEGRPRSGWNDIAIPVANSGSPSVSRRFYSTLIGVDGVGAIGVSWDCENP